MSCGVLEIAKILLLLFFVLIWAPIFWFLESFIRPILICWGVITKNTSNVWKLILIIIIIILLFPLLCFIFFIWGFYQVFLNAIKFVETDDWSDAIGALFWEDKNTLETRINAIIMLWTLSGGYKLV